MSKDIFQQAAKQKLRFSTRLGPLSVEQVYDLPLTTRSGNGFDLDQLAQAVDSDLKASSVQSFVKKTTDRNKQDQLRMDIVLFIIQEKVEAQEAATKRAATAAERAKLIDALAQAEEKELGTLSQADIRAKLAALDAPAAE